AVDANLERVIARLFGLQTPKGPKLQKEIQKLFEDKEIFHQKLSFRSLNEALMDLGRTICQARRATCEICPLKNDCASFQNGSPTKLPVTTEEKAKPSQVHELHLL